MSNAVSVHHGCFGRAALYELDKPIITHAHREAHLIFYLGGGGGSVTVGDVEYRLDQNRAVAVSPWEPHSFSIDDGDYPLITLTIYIKPMWFLEHNKSAQFALSFGRNDISVEPEISQWVNRLCALLMEKEGSDKFDSFLFEVTRTCFEQSWWNNRSEGTHSLASRFIDFRVRRSLRLMQQNFCEDVELDKLARASGLSRPHFFKLFKRQMGVTPNLYLNTLRAEQAIEDLMTTRKSVTDIGFDLGFSSQASFTRFFSSNVGIPPSDYRRVAHIA